MLTAQTVGQYFNNEFLSNLAWPQTRKLHFFPLNEL